MLVTRNLATLQTFLIKEILENYIIYTKRIQNYIKLYIFHLQNKLISSILKKLEIWQHCKILKIKKFLKVVKNLKQYYTNLLKNDIDFHIITRNCMNF